MSETHAAQKPALSAASPELSTQMEIGANGALAAPAQAHMSVGADGALAVTPAAPPAADVATDAARPLIHAPEHTPPADADKIAINVHNTTVAVPPVTVHKTAENASVAVQPASEAVPEPEKPLLAKDILPNPIIITPEVFAKAEKNLAEYFGKCFSEWKMPDLAKNLTITLKNREELTGEKIAGGGEIAASAIDLHFAGDMIEPNHARMASTIRGMLYAHPIIGALIKDTHPGTASYHTGEERYKSHEVILHDGSNSEQKSEEIKYVIGNLSSQDYGLLINALASSEHTKPFNFIEEALPKSEIQYEHINPKIAALAGLTPKPAAMPKSAADEAIAQTFTTADVALEADPRDPRTGTIQEPIGATKPTDGTVYQPPAQGTSTPKSEAQELSAQTVVQTEGSVAPPPVAPLPTLPPHQVDAQLATPVNNVAVPAHAPGKIKAPHHDLQGAMQV